MTTESEIQILMEALLGQWSHFGRKAVGGPEDDGQFFWTEAPFAHLPYNAVLRTQAEDHGVERIRRHLKRFELRKVHFLWVVNPLDTPRNLEDVLIDEGLSLVTREIGMTCEIAEKDEGLSWQHRGSLTGSRRMLAKFATSKP